MLREYAEEQVAGSGGSRWKVLAKLVYVASRVEGSPYHGA